jgi:hypothetical protein
MRYDGEDNANDDTNQRHQVAASILMSFPSNFNGYVMLFAAISEQFVSFWLSSIVAAMTLLSSPCRQLRLCELAFSPSLSHRFVSLPSLSCCECVRR